MQKVVVFYQEHGKDLHAAQDIHICMDDAVAQNARKICRNLERLQLSPQLLQYELANGFPSYPPFQPKDFGGYDYYEVRDWMEEAHLLEIATYCADEEILELTCNFTEMSPAAATLFRQLIPLLEEEARSSERMFILEA